MWLSVKALDYFPSTWAEELFLNNNLMLSIIISNSLQQQPGVMAHTCSPSYSETEKRFTNLRPAGQFGKTVSKHGVVSCFRDSSLKTALSGSTPLESILSDHPTSCSHLFNTGESHKTKTSKHLLWWSNCIL